MAVEMSLLDSGSPDDSIDTKYGVVDILETGEKLLKSSTLESFNKKSHNLAAGILTTDDDDESTEDLLAYDDGFMENEEDAVLVFPSDILEASDEDSESGKGNDSNGDDDNDSIMSDSDTLFED